MFLDDCPLCQLIKSGEKVIQKGTRCHVIETPHGVVAVCVEHQPQVGFQGYVEATSLLFGDDKTAPPNGIIRESLEWAGHWAAELKTMHEGAGKSTVGS